MEEEEENILDLLSTDRTDVEFELCQIQIFPFRYIKQWNPVAISHCDQNLSKVSLTNTI